MFGDGVGASDVERIVFFSPINTTTSMQYEAYVRESNDFTQLLHNICAVAPLYYSDYHNATSQISRTLGIKFIFESRLLLKYADDQVNMWATILDYAMDDGDNLCTDEVYDTFDRDMIKNVEWWRRNVRKFKKEEALGESLRLHTKKVFATRVWVASNRRAPFSPRDGMIYNKRFFDYFDNTDFHCLVMDLDTHIFTLDTCFDCFYYPDGLRMNSKQAHTMEGLLARTRAGMLYKFSLCYAVCPFIDFKHCNLNELSGVTYLSKLYYTSRLVYDLGLKKNDDSSGPPPCFIDLSYNSFRNCSGISFHTTGNLNLSHNYITAIGKPIVTKRSVDSSCWKNRSIQIAVASSAPRCFRHVEGRVNLKYNFDVPMLMYDNYWMMQNTSKVEMEEEWLEIIKPKSIRKTRQVGKKILKIKQKETVILKYNISVLGSYGSLTSDRRFYMLSAHGRLMPGVFRVPPGYTFITSIFTGEADLRAKLEWYANLNTRWKKRLVSEDNRDRSKIDNDLTKFYDSLYNSTKHDSDYKWRTTGIQFKTKHYKPGDLMPETKLYFGDSERNNGIFLDGEWNNSIRKKNDRSTYNDLPDDYESHVVFKSEKRMLLSEILGNNLIPPGVCILHCCRVVKSQFTQSQLDTILSVENRNEHGRNDGCFHKSCTPSEVPQIGIEIDGHLIDENEWCNIQSCGRCNTDTGTCTTDV